MIRLNFYEIPHPCTYCNAYFAYSLWIGVARDSWIVEFLLLTVKVKFKNDNEI